MSKYHYFMYLHWVKGTLHDLFLTFRKMTSGLLARNDNTNKKCL